MTRSVMMLAWSAISLSLTTCGVYAGGNDETRGLRSASSGNDEIRPPQSAPIEFVPKLVLKGRDSKSRDLDPKRDYVAKGDSIEVFVTPQQDVYVYLGYCNGKEFMLYPEPGRTLRAEARHRFKIPEPYNIDDDRVLYVIVSRMEVSPANPDLAIAIAQSRQAVGRGAMDSDCAGGPTPVRSQTPSVIPIDVRAPKEGDPINVVRYELLQRPQPTAR